MHYEALVKIWDNVNNSLTEEQQGSDLYKAGDVIVVRPKGWTWGRNEVKEFLIVDLGEMTEEEAQKLESDVSIEIEELIEAQPDTPVKMQDLMEPAPTNVRKEIIARRRHRVNIEKVLENLSQEEKEKLLNPKIEFQNPLKISIEVQDKINRVDIQNRVARKVAQLQAEKKIIRTTP